jgi:hypothetical protein
MHAVRLTLALAAVALFAGCTASGASTGNFTLVPTKVGWYAGDEASFNLTITSSFLHSSPTFVIDRQFAIEDIELAEKGLKFGGDFDTKDPDAVALTLSRDGEDGTQFTLDAAHPGLDITIRLPGELRDSEYSLELKLFKVGWVKSDAFRVDRH